MRTRNKRCTALAVVMAGLLAPVSWGQWAQWGGPNRNFSVDRERLTEKWPEGGPKKLWSRELGDGYGTILVDGDVLYTMYRIGQDEFTVALDRHGGGTRWEYKNPSPTTKLMEEYGAGPSATPLIAGDRLFSVGTNMVLHCFDKYTGKVVWKHDLAAEFGATVPGRGYSCSPIAYNGTIILPVGGEGTEGQSVIAFDQASGGVVWKNQSFEITHSSPILIRFDGEDQIVFFMAAELVGLNPGNGELLWSHPHNTQYGANLATPLWDGKDRIFCSAAYDSGSRGIRLTRKDGKTVPEELWYSRKLRLHHGNAVYDDGLVFASSGDFGPAFFAAVDLETGKMAWRERGFSKATCVYAGGKLIILDEDGKLALATPTADGLKIHGEAKITEKYSWAAPTLVGSTLYVRDRQHILAFDLG